MNLTRYSLILLFCNYMFKCFRSSYCSEKNVCKLNFQINGIIHKYKISEGLLYPDHLSTR